MAKTNAEELEPLHAAALAEAVATLRRHPAVAVLVPASVFGPDEAGDADEWARCVVVRPGQAHPDPEPTRGTRKRKLLLRRDALVELRAEHAEALNLLETAAKRALHGAVSKAGFQHAMLAQGVLGGAGAGYVSKTLTVGLYLTAPANDGAKAPATRVSPGPALRTPPATAKRKGE